MLFDVVLRVLGGDRYVLCKSAKFSGDSRWYATSISYLQYMHLCNSKITRYKIRSTVSLNHGSDTRFHLLPSQSSPANAIRIIDANSLKLWCYEIPPWKDGPYGSHLDPYERIKAGRKVAAVTKSTGLGSRQQQGFLNTSLPNYLPHSGDSSNFWPTPPTGSVFRTANTWLHCQRSKICMSQSHVTNWQLTAM